MSNKESKRARKEQREAAREAARKAERRRTTVTAIVVTIVVAIGGLLVALSLPPGEEEPVEDAPPADDEATDEPEDEAAADDAEVACGGVVPDTGEDKATYDAPEDVLEDGVDYQAVVETTCGRVVIDLDAERAPEAVNSFAFLAGDGFFDGLEIFRNATSITALQTGAGDDQATWDIGYSLSDELDSAQEDGYEAGAVAMANSGPDSAGSQFFFVYGDAFDDGVDAGGLQPVYTRFGTVVEGLDVLEEIGGVPVDGESPQQASYLESVEVGGPEILDAG